jgi:hypothetical protein
VLDRYCRQPTLCYVMSCYVQNTHDVEVFCFTWCITYLCKIRIGVLALKMAVFNCNVIYSPQFQRHIGMDCIAVHFLLRAGVIHNYSAELTSKTENICFLFCFVKLIFSVLYFSQSRTADEGWSSNLGVGRGANNPPRENTR